MTPLEAIGRLRNRAVFLEKKIAERKLDGQNTYWFEQDVIAIDTAIAALQYVHEMREYELTLPHDEFPAS
jgi:hypothetical protein